MLTLGRTFELGLLIKWRMEMVGCCVHYTVAIMQ
jgi:hypothetical protein